MRPEPKKNINLKFIEQSSNKPTHYCKSWPGHMGQARELMSTDRRKDNSVWWYDMMENSWVSHFAVLTARTKNNSARWYDVRENSWVSHFAALTAPTPKGIKWPSGMKECAPIRTGLKVRDGCYYSKKYISVCTNLKNINEYQYSKEIIRRT